MTTTPLATIVIPARNAASVIGVQLEALSREPHIASYEVLVVDNGSTDATADVARAWSTKLPRLRICDAPDRPGPGYARNVGIAAASSDRILLCDADDRIVEGWADSLLRALDDADAVGGKVVPWDGTEDFTEALGRPDPAPGQKFGFLVGFGSGNAALRRPVWRAVGGFDEALRVAEDIDLSWRINLAGYRVVREESAVICARERSKPTGIFRQNYWYGRGQVMLYARYRAEGMPGTSIRAAIRNWGALALLTPRLLVRESSRRSWCRRAGWRSGRAVGSLVQRVVYL